MLASFTDTVTLAGIGALCAGFGSLLSSILTYRLARDKNKQEKEEHDKESEIGDSDS
jgi:hypothetical protein